MKYTKEERIEIGRKIHESGVSNLKAAQTFGIAEESARLYRIMYEKSANIPHDSSTAHKSKKPQSPSVNTSFESGNEINDYQSMTKEELIEELMKSRIREARLKKGYMVKGVGAEKEYILLDNKNTK